MLSIVTVNYNGSEKTIKLLESLRSQTNKNFDIFVVDNNSNPEEKSKLKNYQTDQTNIIFIENHENLGFSAGCNVGIKKALENGSQWVLLLNNDTWVENDFIATLMANLEAKEGVVGIPLVEGKRTAYGGRLKWLKPTLKHIYEPIGNNIYAIGGGLAIHQEVFDKIGFLDENYFLYFEDADFSFRAREAGFPIILLDGPKANHQVSSTTSKLGAPLLLRYHYRNALYFNFKNGPRRIKISVPFWSFGVLIKQILKIAVKKDEEISKAIIAGVIDFNLDKMGKIKI